MSAILFRALCVELFMLLNKHLTCLTLDKMTDILADNIFNCIFLNENDSIPIPISLKYVTRKESKSPCWH